MPRRVIVAECLHEVCSFNPMPTRLADLVVRRGAEMLAYHDHIGTEISGAVQCLRMSRDIDVVPMLSVRGSTSGGPLAARDWGHLRDEFLQGIRQAGPVDGVYFCLHGALTGEGEMDPEGDLLEQTRRVVGEHVPIVASFDLHGIPTDRALAAIDAPVVYQTYPHVDFFNTGERAAALLVRLIQHAAQPVIARVRIPALVRGDELITSTGVFGDFIRRAQELERAEAGLAAGMFIGNPFTDVPSLGSCAMFVTNGDEQRAVAGAIDLAGRFWEHRRMMQVKLTSLEESVEIATHTNGTVVLMDAADATSSGAPGDSNAIIRALLAVRYEKRVLAPIVDPAVVERAFSAGVCATITVAVGGFFDRRHLPIPVTARVAMLSDGRFRSESFHQEWFSGNTAVLRCANLTLIATERAVHLYDRSLFLSHGLDPREFDAVVVKSPHCQPHMFADWCSRLVNVDAPGATSANLRSLSYRHCPRPMFPLDDDVPFQPRAAVFRRRTG